MENGKDDEKFLMQAGDERSNTNLKRATETFEKYNADTLFLIEEVPNPRLW